MEKGIEVCPHSNSNSNSVEVLDETILILKRCLTLTNEATSGKFVEGTDKVEKERTKTEEVGYDFRYFSKDRQINLK